MEIGGGGRVKNYTVLRLLQQEQGPLRRIHNSNYSHSVSISAKDQVGIYQDKNIVPEQFKQHRILFYTFQRLVICNKTKDNFRWAQENKC